MTPQQVFNELYKLGGKAHEFHKTGLPRDAPKNVLWLCELFEKSTSDDRQIITSKVTLKISWIFFSFSKFMAITAVRQRDKQLVIRGLEALAIENCTLDWRDSTIALAALYHSALKIDCAADDLLQFVASLGASDKTRSLFLSFLGRTLDDKKLEKFGIREATNSEGQFTYASLQ